MKHSGASKIVIRLQYYDKHLFLTIKDNGKGFVEEEHKEGNGLINIRRRTSFLEGDFSINSGETGTLLTISVPIIQTIHA
jgi:signal transduction histidine kinase